MCSSIIQLILLGNKDNALKKVIKHLAKILVRNSFTIKNNLF